MRRTTGLLLTAILFVSSAGTPAPAAPGDLPKRNPTMYSGISYYVDRGSSLSLVCFNFKATSFDGGFFTARGAPVVSMAWSLHDTKGRLIDRHFYYRDDLANVYLTASAGGQTQTQTPQRYDYSPVAGVSFHTVPVQVSGIVRVAYASWGASESCFLGSAFGGLPLIKLSASKARLMFPTDFTGGAAVSSTYGQVAALQSYKRSVTGYAFAMMHKPHGVAKIESPSKKVRFDSTNQTGTPFVSERSKGTWTYTLDASVRTTGTPLLWLMDLPH